MKPQSRFLVAKVFELEGVIRVWWISGKEAKEYQATACHREHIPYLGILYTVFCHDNLLPINDSVRQAFIDVLKGKQWNVTPLSS